MSAEENEAIVRRVLDEILNQGSIRTVDEGRAGNIVHHRPPGERELRSRDGFREDVNAVHANFGDLKYVIEDMLAAADKVAVRRVLQGVHQRGRTWAYRQRANGLPFEASPFSGLRMDRSLNIGSTRTYST